MTSTVGPGMKFLRWILSHLTLILLISLLIFLFWNRNEIWPEEITVIESAVEKRSGQPKTKKTDTTKEVELKPIFVGSNVQGISRRDTMTKNLDNDENKYTPTLSSIDETKGTPSSSDFSERMSKYRKSLPVEEREEMDKAEEVFQQVTDGTIKFPSQSDIEVITDTADQLVIKPMEVSVEDSAMAKMSHYPPEKIQSETHIDSQYESRKYKMLDDFIERSIVEPAEVEQAIKEKQINPVVLDKADNFKTQTVRLRTKDTHTQNLQYQIRNRQRQLQDQMVMLVPLGKAQKSNIKDNTAGYTRKKNNSDQFKAIKPVINTPQQRIMLKEARSAFDKQNFTEAQAKYQQVMNELPELPDVVGELANVYRTQNKVSDYLATNTLFVKRLVKHKRYNEAWSVVKMTNKYDAKIAEQQRKIILRGQAQ